jgi:hypothetical protein
MLFVLDLNGDVTMMLNSFNFTDESKTIEIVTCNAVTVQVMELQTGKISSASRLQ